jgi:hypothetical protein
VCLNIDGSLLESPHTTGFGGLICDTAGVLLKSFYGVASQLSVLFAEILIGCASWA